MSRRLQRTIPAMVRIDGVGPDDFRIAAFFSGHAVASDRP
jgi:hypothetical protein